MLRTSVWLALVLAAIWQSSLAARFKPMRGEDHRQRHVRSLLNAGAAVVSKFKDGLDMAGKFLGLNTAQGVAHLVSSSFLRARPDEAHHHHGLFAGFFRLLGLDATKLGAIALNAVIFIAQLERFSDEESGCIQLLVCKSSPFVWGMQRSVRALLSKEQDRARRLTPIQRMYNHLPSVKEVTEVGDHCEHRFPACTVLPHLM
ncbi:hypothetical protein C0J52_13635 [Blattella germanica]|nr:hypothetical protein C0J52_13635 [Blattella germanica]